MGLWPTKADGNPLANARGSAWDAHCKQSRDRKGADATLRPYIGSAVENSNQPSFGSDAMGSPFCQIDS